MQLPEGFQWDIGLKKLLFHFIPVPWPLDWNVSPPQTIFQMDDPKGKFTPFFKKEKKEANIGLYYELGNSQ